MATTGLETASALLGLINGGKDKKATTTTKTSGGSTTQQTNLSDAAVKEQIDRILAGSGGVRDIGNAARRSGLYNSTTEELLLGNLYGNAAAAGEIARAPTVTTQAPSTSTSTQVAEGNGGGIKDIAMLVGAGIVADQAFKMFDGKGVGGGLGELIGFGKGTKPTSLEQDLAGSGAISFGAGPDTATGLTYSGGVTPGNNASNPFASILGQGMAGIGNTTGSTAGGTKGFEDFDLFGAISSGLGSLFSGGGGLGSVLGAVTGGVGAQGGGSRGGSSGGSIICTALMEKGELDAELYEKGTAYLAQLDQATVLGYHLWATSVATKIRNGSKLALVLSRPFARSRTGLLATSGTFRDHCRFPLGTLTKFIGEPVCTLVGKLAITAVMQAEINKAFA
jgi:hypothetical protein